MKKEIKSPWGYIEMNPNYLREAAEVFPSIFTPAMWWQIEPSEMLHSDEEWDKELGNDFDWDCWPEETSIPLTFEGEMFVKAYLYDGREYGYKYSMSDIWEMVRDPKNGYRMTEAVSEEDFERLSAVAMTDFKKYVSLLKNEDEKDFYWWANSLCDYYVDFDAATTDEAFANFAAKLGEEKCRQIWHEIEMYERIVNF